MKIAGAIAHFFAPMCLNLRAPEPDFILKLLHVRLGHHKMGPCVMLLLVVVFDIIEAKIQHQFSTEPKLAVALAGTNSGT